MKETFIYDINYIDNNGEEHNYKLTTQAELNQPQIITKCKEHNNDFFKLLNCKRMEESMKITESSEQVTTLYDLIFQRGEGIDITDETYNVMVYFDFIKDDNDDDQKFLRKLAKELHCVSYTDTIATVDLTDWVEHNFYELDQLFDLNAQTKEDEIAELVTTVMPGIIGGYTTDSVYEALLQQPEGVPVKNESKEAGTIRTEDLPQMEIYELIYNGFKDGQDIKDNVTATAEAIRDEDLTTYSNEDNLDTLIRYITMKANEIYHSEELEESKEIKAEEVLDDMDEVEKEYKEAYGKDLDLKTVPCVIAKDTYLSGWGQSNPDKLYQVVLCGNSVEAANIENTMNNKAKDEGLSNIRRAFGISSRVKGSVSYKIGRYAKAWNDLSDGWYETNFNTNKEAKTETTNKELDSMKQDLYRREREALKELGDKNWENLVKLKDRLPKELYDKFEKEETELWAIRMMHSILTYEPKDLWTVDTIMNDKYMEKYIKQLGRDRVEELAKQEVDEYVNNAVINYAGTDSEGVSYNSVAFKNESLDYGEPLKGVNKLDTSKINYIKESKDQDLINTAAEEIAQEAYKYVQDHGYDIKDYMDGSKESKEALNEIDDILENFTTNRLDELENKLNKEFMFWYEYEPSNELGIKVIIETA